MMSKPACAAVVLVPALWVPVLLVPSLRAQEPPGYYASVNASSAATLRATLHAVIDDHTRFPYTASSTDTWTILELAQQNPANSTQIVDIYRNAAYAKIGGGVGPYNREHAWPKSYGFPVDGSTNYPYTDCFHLHLCDSGYNTARSNRVYAGSTSAGNEYTTNATNGTGGGSGSFPGNSNWADSAITTGRWQVWGDRRGDCARAIFYMDVRYEGGQHSSGASEPDLQITDTVSLITASNTGSNTAGSAWMGLRSTLLLWHAADPVDARERARNDSVYAFQGNRNPFVDHPEWVDCLYSGLCGDSVPPAAPTGLLAVGSGSQIVLDWRDNTESDLASYRVLRATSSTGPYTQISVAPVTASTFVDVGVPKGAAYWYVVRAVDTSNNVSTDSLVARARWKTLELPGTAQPPSSSYWINELHYDNVGADTGEFVEVAGPAGASLAGWSLVLYNGTNGALYATIALSGTIPAQQNGFGCRGFAATGLQNGSPDGVALVDPNGVVVEFLSYEGALTATNGPAAGRSAVQIPTAEDDTTPAGFSLQRQGTGSGSSAFAWSAPVASTLGTVNTGQTLQ